MVLGQKNFSCFPYKSLHTRVVFYVRRMGDLMKTAKVNAYSMHIFGKIELLSIHATLNYFLKMHYFNDFKEAKTYLYI